MKKKNRESETINTEIHKEIDLLEEELLSLKHADDFFIQRDKYIAPQIFQEYRQVLLTQIQKWRNRKIKIIGDHEVEIAATEYSVNLQKYIKTFF